MTYKIKLSRASLRNTQQSIATNGTRIRFDAGIGDLVKENIKTADGSSLAIEVAKAPAPRNLDSMRLTFPENIVAGDYLITVSSQNTLAQNWLAAHSIVGTTSGGIHFLDQTGKAEPKEGTVGATGATFNYFFSSVNAGGAVHHNTMCQVAVRVLTPNAQKAWVDLEMSAAPTAAGRVFVDVTQISDSIFGAFPDPQGPL